MSRLRQNAEGDTLADFLAEVNAQRGRFGYSTQKAFGEAIGVCQATTGNYLRNPASIPFCALRAMVRTLKPNPDIVLRALGYTTQDIKKLAKEYT